MNIDDFSVAVLDKTLTVVAYVDPMLLPGSVWAPRKNAVGAWQMTLPEYLADGTPVLATAKLLEPGSRLVVMHTSSNVWPFIQGPTVGREKTITSENPAGEWTFTGKSELSIVDGGLIYPSPDVSAAAQQPGKRYKYSGIPAETAVLTMIRNQLYTFPYRRVGIRERLSFATTAGRGPVVSIDERFSNMLTVVQRLLADTNLILRIERQGTNLHVRIVEGGDYRAVTKWDLENGQLSEERTRVDAPSVTTIVNETEGVVVELLNNAAITDGWDPQDMYMSTGADLVTATTAANEQLLAGAAQSGFSVVPRDDISGLLPEMLGGTISVVTGDVVRDAVLNELIVSVSGDGVHVSATIGNPDGTDWEGMTNAAVVDLSSRVEALEQRPALSDSVRQPFSPVFTTGLTLGNGTAVGEYWVSGGHAHARVRAVLGSTSVVDGDIAVALPIERLSTDVLWDGRGRAVDSSVGVTSGSAKLTVGVQQTQALLRWEDPSTTYTRIRLCAATLPFAWATGDYIEARFDWPLT
ncbi:Gp37-like protein [Microbacterium gilvum]|uniref:Gp28/Gp37-like domain-containing protein n=1 Tax=Microbacterium gilvum TaxID=1336204 RepID=A0ABP8ZQS4_9MICO